MALLRRRKPAVKVVDAFGGATIYHVDVNMGGR